MLILTETGFQVHYDHYEVGLSDNDFLPVTNKAPGAPYVYAYNNRPGNMLILTETGFQVHYDHYEVGLSDNDFLPVTNKAGESYRYLALV